MHWSFWLFTTLLGVVDPASVVSVSLWIAAVFISIVVHELGPALAARAYGMALGSSLRHGRAGRISTGAQELGLVLIAAAGPGPGFLLAGLVVALGVALGYSVRLDPLNFRVGDGTLIDGRMGLFVRDLLFVNVFWGILNLLPIQPLDEGDITAAILARRNLDRP